MNAANGTWFFLRNLFLVMAAYWKNKNARADTHKYEVLDLAANICNKD